MASLDNKLADNILSNCQNMSFWKKKYIYILVIQWRNSFLIWLKEYTPFSTVLEILRIEHILLSTRRGTSRPRLLTVGDCRRICVLVSTNTRLRNSRPNITCEFIRKKTVPLLNVLHSAHEKKKIFFFFFFFFVSEKRLWHFIGKWEKKI